MGRRYNELYEKYRKLQGSYNQMERSLQNLKQEYKKQEKILSYTKELNGLLEEKSFMVSSEYHFQ